VRLRTPLPSATRADPCERSLAHTAFTADIWRRSAQGDLQPFGVPDFFRQNQVRIHQYHGSRSASYLVTHPLFITKSDHWVDAHRPPRRDVAGRERNKHQQDGHDCKRGRICRLDLE
jgi:hypothetical protein